jgi:hypothetical protein
MQANRKSVDLVFSLIKRLGICHVGRTFDSTKELVFLERGADSGVAAPLRLYRKCCN